ncbi:DEKNAAC100227 [Brettanomyces naardenensis]|uniref:DEKNAAC100227 n=1 Tax=Brettanomyces naardenensis TaxID=13370 RepID=A0A448YEM3_BRENA|nr:DEKNAAC100227 [Brettanomyces naardenensis]
MNAEPPKFSGPERKHSVASSKNEESLHLKEALEDEEVKDQGDVNRKQDDKKKDDTAEKSPDSPVQGPILSITEITDGMTERMNEILMEINRSDGEMSKVFGQIEKRLDNLDKTFR